MRDTITTKKMLVIFVFIGLIVLAAYPLEATTCRTGNLFPTLQEGAGEVRVDFEGTSAAFRVEGDTVAVVQLYVYDPADRLIYDSGLTTGNEVLWLLDRVPEEGAYRYLLTAWDDLAKTIGSQSGQLVLASDQVPTPFARALSYDVTGNYTISGLLGVGIDPPERAVHLRGNNAVFRMDRSVDTAAFILVRTDPNGSPYKTFVVGVNSSGQGQGEFVINDLGTAVTGPGTRRLTIGNTGNATFTGTVTSYGTITASSSRFKENIRPLSDGPEKLMALQGVRFTWKGTGKEDIGLLAEDVVKLFPEIVDFELDGITPKGLDYGKLSAVLIEAAKAQEKEIRGLSAECEALKAEWTAKLKILNDRLKME